MKELLIATKNPGKYKEILEALKELSLEMVFLKELRLAVKDDDFIEDGNTFKENAYKKAKYYFDKTGILTLAEDSGVVVEALKDELGVRTRRFGKGENASDKEWIDFFMERMIAENNREARFECCACLYGNGIEEYFEGTTNGVITNEIMAPLLEGLPLSSCFLPEGSEKVYAALSSEEKNTISHRGKAFDKARRFLGLLKARYQG
jgi:XTP/dITP diphosphohydrolase